MSDNQRILAEVKKKLKDYLGDFLQSQVMVLAVMVAGIVAGRSSRLNRIAEETAFDAKVPSVIRQLNRFIQNEKVEVESLYRSFAEELIEEHKGKRIKVAMDGSLIGRGCVVLMAGLVQNNRLLPLCWKVYPGGKGHLGAERHIEVLQMLLSLVGRKARLTLLGDGEFDTTEMLEWVKENTRWKWVVRTAKDSLIRQGGKWMRMDEFTPKKGLARIKKKVYFTKSQPFGQVSALGWWRQDCKEPIYLLSNLTSVDAICNSYAERPLIETFFSDQKSRGFGLEKSRVEDPERLSRVLLAACIAYLWIVGLGAEVVEKELQHFIQSRSRPEKSFFRLGLDWLKYLLNHQLPLSVRFQIPIIA